MDIDLMEAIGELKYKTNCFAYLGKGACSALVRCECRNCPFYKTSYVMAAQVRKVAERLEEQGESNGYAKAERDLVDRYTVKANFAIE